MLKLNFLPQAIFVAVAGLVQSGCMVSDDFGSTYKVYIDPHFSGEHIGTIIAAVDHWNSAVNAHGIHLQLTPVVQDVACTPDQACAHVITIRKSSFEAVAAAYESFGNPAPPPGEVLGGYTYRETSHAFTSGQDDWAVSYIADDCDALDWYGNVAHELGHALGLRHTGRDSIMYFEANGRAPDMTCVDVEQFGWIRAESPSGCAE